MMSIRLLACALGLVVSMSAGASAVTLDFSNIQDKALINNFYNGGTDSANQTGPGFGVIFLGPAQVITSSDPSPNYANSPTPEAVMFFTQGLQVGFESLNGFTDGFSFYYSSFVDLPDIQILDVNLNLLAEITGAKANLSRTCPPNSVAAYCHFDPIGVSFSGTATYVLFTGGASATAYDNVTFGSNVPGLTGTPVPGSTPAVAEPGSVALVGLALAGLVIARRRKPVRWAMQRFEAARHPK